MLLAAGSKVLRCPKNLLNRFLNILKGQRAALPSASIMLKQPLSSFRGQVILHFYTPCAKLTIEVGIRARNPAARDEEHEKTNGDTNFHPHETCTKFSHSLKYWRRRPERTWILLKVT